MSGAHASPIGCPSCGVELGSSVPLRCPACGVGLGGDVGRRLLAVDQRIAELMTARRDLLVRLRREAALAGRPPVTARSDADGPSAPERPDHGHTGRILAPPAPQGRTVPPSPGSFDDVGVTAGARRWLAEAGPQSLLAVAGVLLLAIAAIVFTAVTWRDLPMLARAAVLLGTALAAAALTGTLARRELRRTGEATSVLTIALLAVLGNGLWRAGLLDGLGRDSGILAMVGMTLAAAAHVLARATTMRSPRVLAAWLSGIATYAAGVWLTAPRIGFTTTALDVLAILATGLAVAVVAGGYAARVLVVLPRWRLATLTAAGLLWTVTAVVAPVVLGSLAPGRLDDGAPFAIGLAAVAGSVGVAALARTIRGPLASRWPAVGTAGMWLAGTLGCAGALFDRLDGWPDVHVVVGLAGGTALLLRYRAAWRRRSAAIGMIPISLLAVAPVAQTLLWLSDVAAGALASSGPLAPPAPARLASLVALAAVGMALAAGVAAGRLIWRIGGAVTWAVAALGAATGMAVLAPSRPEDLGGFVACAAVASAAVALAAVAGRAGVVRRPVAAGGIAFAVTAGAAGALTGRLASWPALPLVVPLAIGLVLVRWPRSGDERRATMIGVAPIAAAAAAPVMVTVEWLGVVLALRLLVPWPDSPALLAVPAPAATTMLSAAAVVALVGGLAALIDRGRAPAMGALAAAGALVVMALGVIAWPLGGGAVIGLMLIAAVVGVQRRTATLLAADLGLVGVSAATVVVALTTSTVTIATLALAAALTSAALPTPSRRRAWAAAGVCSAEVLGLVAAVTAAATRGPGPVGLALTLAAAGVWLAAASVRTHRTHAAAIELSGTAAFVIGVGLGAARGALWLGMALAVLAVASAAITVWRRDRRWLRWVAAAAASGSSWAFLADADVDVVEAYTAPPALLIIALAAIGLHAHAERSSWPVLGTGLTLLTAPTLLQLVADPTDLGRLAAAVLVGSALVIAGRRYALQSPLVVGVAVLSLAAVTQHRAITDVVPRWVLLAAAGTLLLWLSAGYERQRTRLVAARRRLLAMR